MAPAGFTSLPAEIIIEIFTYLETESTAEERLRRDPEYRHGAVVKKYKSDCHLKEASLVSRQWRHYALPLLFRNVIWTVDRFFKPALPKSSQIEVLAFLNRKNLCRYVEHFIVLIKPPAGEDLTWRSLTHYWGILPTQASLRHLPRVIHHTVLDRWVRKSTRWNDEGLAPPWEYSRAWNNNWLWHLIFACVDPLRITLVGSKGILAALLSRNLSVKLSLHKKLAGRLHAISLSRESRLPNPSFQPSFQATGPHIPIDLFRIRSWTSILINDSLCSDYVSGEVTENRRKSFLFPLLFDLYDPSIRELYKTIQTISCIFNSKKCNHLRDVLKMVPPVERLDVQFIPRDLHRGCTDPKYLSSRRWDPLGPWDLFCRLLMVYQIPKSVQQLTFKDEISQETWDTVVEEILPNLEGDWEAGSKGTVRRCDLDPNQVKPGQRRRVTFDRRPVVFSSPYDDLVPLTVYPRGSDFWPPEAPRRRNQLRHEIHRAFA